MKIMAIYRTIQMSFWTDSKVIDDFSIKDRYFFLYLLTNPHTNLCGCYELSIQQASNETGYSKDIVEKLIDKMEQTHKVIRYSRPTKEILILNWGKYNWTKSPKFKKPLFEEIKSVKNTDFVDFLREMYEKCDTKSAPHLLRDNRKDDKEEIYKEIIDYLNTKADKRFSCQTKAYREYINGRMNEGYTIDDFKKVIDNKVSEWKDNDKMNRFLKPNTLFAPSHFDEYLNQGKMKNNKGFELMI